MRDLSDKIRKYVIFITLFSLFIGGGEWIYRKCVNDSIFVSMAFRSVYMFIPAVSVFLIEKWKFKKIFSEYKISFKNIAFSKAFKYLFYVAFILPLFMLFFVYFWGDQIGLTGFGKLIISNNDLDARVLSSLPSFFGDWKCRFLIGLPAVMFISLFSGITINAVLALGEEIGWRGFLEKNLNMTRARKSLLIGTIWGLWHTPLILMGHNYGDHFILGIFVMVIVCIVLSFFFSNSLYSANTLLIPAAMHGIINSFSRTFAVDIFMKTSNPLLGPPMGLVFAMSVLAILFVDKLVCSFKKS